MHNSLQEVDRTVEGFITGGDVSRAELWISAMHNALKPVADFTLVRSLLV